MRAQDLPNAFGVSLRDNKEASLHQNKGRGLKYLYVNIPWDDMRTNSEVYEKLITLIGAKSLYYLARKNKRLKNYKKGDYIFVPKNHLKDSHQLVKMVGMEKSIVIQQEFRGESIFLKSFSDWRMLIKDLYIFKCYYIAGYSLDRISTTIGYSRRSVALRIVEINKCFKIYNKPKVSKSGCIVVPPEELFM